jgi:hypothetical protein
MFAKRDEPRLCAILQAFKKSFCQSIGANRVMPDSAGADLPLSLDDSEASPHEAGQDALSRSPN